MTKDMRVIVSKILPPKGFVAINLLGVVVVREENKRFFGDKSRNHEAIHTAQMRELGFIFFYVIYVLEWLFNLFRYGFGGDKAYYMISFEREAYEHEAELDYLARRRHFSQWRDKQGEL